MRRPSERQPIAISAKGEDRLDGMAPIGQLAAYVEREVELGRRDFACGIGQGAASAGVSPLASFALTRVATSSSAVTSAARHAKRAS